MTVKELIERLQECPNKDAIMVCQSDSEGNGYSPLEGIDSDAVYKAETSYSGEVYDIKWSASGAIMEEDEWEEFKKTTPACVVLYPVN
jgi:hypothetical protein